ncbi:MAG: molecular chaperone HscC [Clostridiales bacterium]|nr:molecular chaperone HscC [Clostridiales bacterium]
MAKIGIDLGTTNSLAVVYKDGQTVRIKNSLDSYITPSAVSVDEDGKILVGEAAKDRLISHPKVSASEFKRDMGLRKTVSLNGTEYTPEELSSLILKKIKADSEAFLGEPVEEAIISVPAYFDDNSRRATRIAADLSGLKVERLINEPSAAALAYLDKNGYEDGTYMVIDFGGGTLDVSVVDVFENIIEILAVAGNNRLGGKDFNEAIARDFCRKNELDYDALTPAERAVIYRASERAKIALSDIPMVMMEVPLDTKKLVLTLNNKELISISKSIFEGIREPVRKAIHDSRKKLGDIDRVILVGGSCKMPTVREFIRQITGIVPDTSIDPDIAIAEGAGIYAAMKNKELKDVVLTDICPFTLGVAVNNDLLNDGSQMMSSIIPRNSTLPSSIMKPYSASSENQSKITIKVYQGESIDPDKNLFLGELNLDCPPTKFAAKICDVKMTYDINGILIVDVFTADGLAKTKAFRSNSSVLTDEEVEQMRKKIEEAMLVSPEDEKYRALLARAERVYEESFEDQRLVLQRLIMAFKGSIALRDPIKVQQSYKALSDILDTMEY